MAHLQAQGMAFLAHAASSMPIPVPVPPELQTARPLLLEEYVRSRLLQFVGAFTQRISHLSPGTPLDTVHRAAEEALSSLPPPEYRNRDLESRDLQLVFRHDCLAPGCLDPQCALCQHNTSRRCTVNFDRKYLVNDVLKAKCNAVIRVELVDRNTGLLVEEDVPDMKLEICVLDGNMYDAKFVEGGQQVEGSGPATDPDEDLVNCALLFNKKKNTPLLVSGVGGTNDTTGGVSVPFMRGKALLPDMHVTDSSEAILSGRKPPFRLLVTAVQPHGSFLNIRHAVSEGFVVATRRTRTAGKADIPSVEDHVSKLEHMGKETVKKLQDIQTAATQSGVEIDIPENCVQKVGEFKQLALRADQDGHLRQKLQHVLKLSKEKWDEARDHAMRAVVADNRMRVWYANGQNLDLGIIFICRLGIVDLERPVGLVQNRPGSNDVEATLVAQLTPQQRETLRTLQPHAVNSWWDNGHPGWAIFPMDSEHFLQTGNLSAMMTPDANGALSAPPFRPSSDNTYRAPDSTSFRTPDGSPFYTPDSSGTPVFRTSSMGQTLGVLDQKTPNLQGGREDDSGNVRHHSGSQQPALSHGTVPHHVSPFERVIGGPSGNTSLPPMGGGLSHQQQQQLGMSHQQQQQGGAGGNASATTGYKRPSPSNASSAPQVEWQPTRRTSMVHTQGQAAGDAQGGRQDVSRSSSGLSGQQQPARSNSTCPSPPPAMPAPNPFMSVQQHHHLADLAGLPLLQHPQLQAGRDGGGPGGGGGGNNNNQRVANLVNDLAEVSATHLDLAGLPSIQFTALHAAYQQAPPPLKPMGGGSGGGAQGAGNQLQLGTGVGTQQQQQLAGGSGRRGELGHIDDVSQLAPLLPARPHMDGPSSPPRASAGVTSNMQQQRPWLQQQAWGDGGGGQQQQQPNLLSHLQAPRLQLDPRLAGGNDGGKGVGGSLLPPSALSQQQIQQQHLAGLPADSLGVVFHGMMSEEIEFNLADGMEISNGSLAGLDLTNEILTHMRRQNSSTFYRRSGSPQMHLRDTNSGLNCMQSIEQALPDLQQAYAELAASQAAAAAQGTGDAQRH